MDALNKNKTNSKILWQHMRSTIQTASNIGPKLTKQNNDQSPVNVSELANEFNKHFANITDQYKPQLTSVKSESNHQKLLDFIELKKPCDIEFDIPYVTSEFVHKYLLTLPESKATGLDYLSAKLLKLSANVIYPHITKICNNIIGTGNWPSQWKQARVVPIYKSGSPNDLGNYCPISVLPILSKILERHIHNHLYTYLTQWDLILNKQSGFRLGHSCETMLLRFTDYLLEQIDAGNLCGALMIDLRKAFDLVNHKILLNKLSLYGMSKNIMQIFRSYLSNRLQCVSYEGMMSDTQEVTIGVPQGSILGPLFFIIFMNDIVLELKCSSEFEMFADDSTHYTSSKTVHDLNMKLTENSKPICNWISKNEMILNVNKTESMIFGSRIRCKDAFSSFEVSVCDQPITSVECHKLVGIYLDRNILWDNHINKLCQKLRSKLYLFNRIKHFLPHHARIQFFNGIVQPNIDYCASVWGNCSKQMLNRIYIILKQFGRSILNIRKATDIDTKTLFTTLNWLPIDEHIKFVQLVQMWKIINNQAPLYLQDNFTTVRQIHDKQTRQNTKTQLYVPKYKLDYGKRTFKYIGSTLWNGLPESLRNIKSIVLFKENYKSYIKPKVFKTSIFFSHQ